MKKSFQLKLSVVAISTSLLFGCGKTETTIIEKEATEVPADDTEADSGYTISSLGRLAVLSSESNDAAVFDLDNNELLNTFTLINDTNTLTSSAGYRFAIITSRDQDYVGFIDGGLWREDHTAHLHDYKQSPAQSSYELNASRPTHIIKGDAETAFFFDGNADTGAFSSVSVLTDNNISNESAQVPSLQYDINMHGVAEPRGEYLIASIRRSDDQTTSAATVLPDQVGVFHLHDSEYEQEQLFELTCPDLHGAAQNSDYVVFGCSDSVLVAFDNNDVYEASTINNIDILGDSRIGSLYGHENATSLIGVASGHDGAGAILISVNPQLNQMEALEWQPQSDTTIVSYGFSYEGEHFLALDSAGNLNILSAHEHDGFVNWELEQKLVLSDQDITTMPQGAAFSMTMAQNADFVYVSDPIAKQVLKIDLTSMTVVDNMQINFASSSITWVGIPD